MSWLSVEPASIRYVGLGDAKFLCLDQSVGDPLHDVKPLESHYSWSQDLEAPWTC